MNILEELPIEDTRNVLLLLKIVKKYIIDPQTRAYRLYINNYNGEEWLDSKRHLVIHEGEIIFPSFPELKDNGILSLNNFIKVCIK